MFRRACGERIGVLGDRGVLVELQRAAAEISARSYTPSGCGD